MAIAITQGNLTLIGVIGGVRTLHKKLPIVGFALEVPSGHEVLRNLVVKPFAYAHWAYFSSRRRIDKSFRVTAEVKVSSTTNNLARFYCDGKTDRDHAHRFQRRRQSIREGNRKMLATRSTPMMNADNSPK